MDKDDSDDLHVETSLILVDLPCIWIEHKPQNKVID